MFSVSESLFGHHQGAAIVRYLVVDSWMKLAGTYCLRLEKLVERFCLLYNTRIKRFVEKPTPEVNKIHAISRCLQTASCASIDVATNTIIGCQNLTKFATKKAEL